MHARRFAALALVSAWLSPTVLVAAIALHVALHHAHDAVAAHAALFELAEHGHAHTGRTGEHEHEATPATEVAARRALVAAVPAAPDEVATALDLAFRQELAGEPPPAPPPRVSGAPLLALISTLRI